MNFGVIHRPMPGESVCGDNYLILEGDRSVLLAVADGLGHGSKAAEASAAAVKVIREGNTKPLRHLMKECHERLRRTRGAVIGIALIELGERQLRYVGVGNIRARIISQGSQVRPNSRQGLVGYNMATCFGEVYQYHPGDVVIMHTDGLSEKFNTDDISGFFQKNAQTLAEEIADRSGKETDDVTVIVAK